jgi:hypothetical protein
MSTLTRGILLKRKERYIRRQARIHLPHALQLAVRHNPVVSEGVGIPKIPLQRTPGIAADTSLWRRYPLLAVTFIPELSASSASVLEANNSSTAKSQRCLKNPAGHDGLAPR